MSLSRKSNHLHGPTGLKSSALFALSLALSVGVAVAGCSGSGGRRGKKSPARQWLESPSSGQKNGNKFVWTQLDTVFEIPDTLYVFKNCEEASHSPEGDNKWVPLVSCGSTGTPSGDPDGLGEAAPSSSGDSEAIALTFFLAPKERPVDERAVAFFTNEYKEAGLKVEELAFNDDYFSKTGIFAKLQIMDESGTNALREIQQFMWPVDDVLFIARMEYPFGDTRAIQQDWKSIMPYFKVGKVKDE
jgi:hypothetical protein